MRQGQVYKLYHSTDPNTLYVGSTTQKLNLRMHQHFMNCKRRPASKSPLYALLKQHNFVGFQIESLGDLEFKDKKDLLQLENKTIQELKPTLNVKKRAYLDPSLKLQCMRDYYNEHKQAILDQQKQYRDQNPGKQLLKRKRYRTVNKNKHHCDMCNVSFVSQSEYNKHNNTNKHRKRASEPVPPRILG